MNYESENELGIIWAAIYYHL